MLYHLCRTVYFIRRLVAYERLIEDNEKHELEKKCFGHNAIAVSIRKSFRTIVLHAYETTDKIPRVVRHNRLFSTSFICGDIPDGNLLECGHRMENYER